MLGGPVGRLPAASRRVGSGSAARRSAAVRPWPESPGRASEPVTEPLPLPLPGHVEGALEADPLPGFAQGRRPGRLGTVLARWLPERWRGARVDPGRAGAVALILVAAIGAVIAAIGVWSGRPQAEPVPPALPVVAIGPGSGPGAGPATAAASLPPEPAAGSGAPEPAELVVDAAGRVRSPGLVRVPEGARVADVLDAAGGVLPGTDLGSVNLARKVSDGEQVAVGVPPAPDAQPVAGSGASGAGAGPAAPSGGKTDLNRASLEQLDALPGVGPVTAQRILDWRARNGRFSRVDQLREIEGIGERKFAQLREVVAV